MSEIGSNLSSDTPKIQKAKVGPQGLPKTMRIILEDSDSIPPTGLFLSLNGKAYMLRAGEPADVPLGLIEILDHAVESTPQIDPATRQVLGYRDRLKYPYRVVSTGG